MAKLPIRALLTVVVAAAVYFGAAPFFRSRPPKGTSPLCDFRELENKPEWISSAVWTADGRELLVVDPVYRRLLRFSDTGRSLGTFPPGIEPALRNLPPYFIRAYRGGLLLELSDERMVALDSTYTPRSRIDLHEWVAEGDTRIESLFLWTPVGDDLIALSDLHRAKNDSWSSSFVRIPLYAPGGFTLLSRVSAEARKLYRLGHPYLTTLGNAAYLISMEGNADLLRIPRTGAEVQPLSVPLPGRLLPSLPPFRSSTDFVPLMRAIEQATMPVGLYGWGGFLYVLSRAPSARGTQWTLTKIDPKLDRIVGSSRLPTSAKHLTVVPGARNWAFIEKGPVVSWGHQKTNRVLLVPASQLRKSVLPGNLCD